VEIPEHDEELRQLHAVIHGALCHHQKHSHEQLRMIPQRRKIASWHHQGDIDSGNTHPGKPVSPGSARGRLHRSDVCRRMTSAQRAQKHRYRQQEDIIRK